ncbi:hypothetical protein JTE90_023802 [Oedothorax gibbosus]|uniref:Chromosome transmission fidelity protein 8 n=1 Tax=Oedothorax gibbosus TaxID=931172 RepID=A0AAV6VKQ4_9ARAC|nr:hypothetical protein JTE90_023802 [Oedothorax gibbosus]
MVQMLVKIQDDPQSLKEWVIVEVQGDLESSSGDTIGGKQIGHLIFTSKERPILIIGYHILYGKVIENNPPLAVLKRSRLPNVQETNEKKNSATDYTILALIRKRITFKTRPKPMVSICH